MAALLDFSKGYAAFTRREGSEPAWHREGGETPADAPLEVWLKNAGLEFYYRKADVEFKVPGTDFHKTMPKRHVLYRDDNNQPLSIVSNTYKIVQPSEVLEFFRDFIEAGDMEMETAGALMDGRRIWALARTGKNFSLKGVDKVENYLLLVSSVDNTLSTTAMLTSVRVVCNNTLQLAANGKGQSRVKVPHNRVFDPDEVKKQMGFIDGSWEEFHEQARALADRKVTDEEVRQWLVDVLGDPQKPIEEQPNVRAMKAIYDLFEGEGQGSDLPTARHTAWGLVNAVTEFTDYHVRARSNNYRLNNAWLGSGAKLKAKAFENALKLVA